MVNPQVSRHANNPAGDALASLPTLGVGVMYNPSLPDFLRSNVSSVDYVAITSDMFWDDLGKGQSPRYVELEPWVEFLSWMAEHYPIVAHNISLSIGSAELFDTEYVEHLKNWQERYHFPWHSDHLSYFQVNDDADHVRSAGLAVPVPYDWDVLDMIADRIDYIQTRIPVPFLIENNVYYIDIPDQDMTEAEFMNRLAARTGCGILLDLHNVYVNACNHDFNPFAFLDQLDLSRVVEIHIAGGNEMGGMYTDSHAGPCPQPVWELLDRVVALAPNLCAVTYEFHDSYYHLLEAEGVRDQLEQARTIWSRYH